MTTDCNETLCALCGRALQWSGQGRPPRYCSPAHRLVFHRLRHANEANMAAAVKAWREEHLLPADRPMAERVAALSDLADLLDGVGPLRGLAALRRLAEYGDSMVELLNDAERLTWAAEAAGLSDLVDGLAELANYRDDFERMAELEDLAGRVKEAARHVRQFPQWAEDLGFAADPEEEE